MVPATLPANESERLLSLNEYGILDSLPEVEFDDITRIAAQVCGTPMSLVTIMDYNRQWFKSHHGTQLTESPRDYAFCGYTINNDGKPFIVEDTLLDSRFFDNPLTVANPNIQFYAGIPLVNPDGYALGALCVVDNKPNKLNPEQLETIEALARQVMRLFELRKTVALLNKKQTELKAAYDDLDKFSTIASHDLRSPLNNIISLTTLLNEIYSDAFDEDGNAFMMYLKESAYQLSRMVNSILEYSKSSTLIVDQKEYIDLPELIENIEKLLNPPPNIRIRYLKTQQKIFTSLIAIKQILLNLINNAIKYNDKPEGIIEISVTDNEKDYQFTISDNGPGVTDDEKEKMFDLFERLKYNSTDKEGTGIGLSVVKRLVEKLNGSIQVESELGVGMSTILTIPKK